MRRMYVMKRFTRESEHVANLLTGTSVNQLSLFISMFFFRMTSEVNELLRCYLNFEILGIPLNLNLLHK